MLKKVQYIFNLEKKNENRRGAVLQNLKRVSTQSTDNVIKIETQQ